MNHLKIRKHLNHWVYIVLGGLIFCVIFNIAYSQINPDWFLIRDDGVITFSHAKNLVDYGFIGVNPSGERLEGFSAPIQFLVFAIAYLIGHVSYETFTLWQTQLATFVLGSIFTTYFLYNPRLSILATTVAAAGLTFCTSFFEWHASGMENALTHILFAGSVLLLFHFALKGRIQLAWAWVFLFACLSRLDGIYHIAPLLFIFAIYWLLMQKSYRGLYLAFVVTFLWLCFQGWRLYYFGSLASNTMLAQNINLMGRLEALLTLQRWYFLDSLQLSKLIFASHAGYLLITILPFAFFVRWTRATLLLFFLSLSLVLTAWFNPFIFGETRLDPTRSTTQMAYFVLVATFCIIQGIKSNWLKIFAILIVLPVLFFSRVAPYYLCCGVSSFEKIQNELKDAASSEELFRPTIANPDLGLMSWSKQFNVVDLGMLGSSIFSKVRQGPLLADYFFDYVAPDLIESHETWSCQYWDTLFSDPRFRQRYIPIRETTVNYGNCGNTGLPKGIWIRRDIQKNSRSAERLLMNDLDNSLSVDRVKEELRKCQSQASDKKDCSYIARTAYRRLPEFRNLGKIDGLINIFEDSRTKPFDQYLLRGHINTQAHQELLAWLAQNYLSTHQKQLFNSNEGFNIGIDHHFIVIVKSNCQSKDLKNSFFVQHISDTLDSSSFNNPKYSFDFTQHGFRAGSICMATVPIKSEAIGQSILIGQWIPKKNLSLWQFKIPAF
jgi:hypothetical protein